MFLYQSLVGQPMLVCLVSLLLHRMYSRGVTKGKLYKGDMNTSVDFYTYH